MHPDVTCQFQTANDVEFYAGSTNRNFESALWTQVQNTRAVDTSARETLKVTKKCQRIELNARMYIMTSQQNLFKMGPREMSVLHPYPSDFSDSRS
jgi:hypothetical protein